MGNKYCLAFQPRLLFSAFFTSLSFFELPKNQLIDFFCVFGEPFDSVLLIFFFSVFGESSAFSVFCREKKEVCFFLGFNDSSVYSLYSFAFCCSSVCPFSTKYP